MYNVSITPSLLHGEVRIPPSKSVAHRLIICSALAKGKSVIKNVSMSQDIKATINAMKSCGADIQINGTDVVVNGIDKPMNNAHVDCCESGSTLRFLIPVCSALGINSEFTGRGKLPTRPIDTYINEMSLKGVTFDYSNTMPFSFKGKLKSGNFEVAGDISSQFITGYMFALPLLDGDSKIILTSKLESKPYVDITIDCLKKFGVIINETDYGYFIKGCQKYICCNTEVESDFSQAAFFLVANALGSDIKIDNLNYDSFQGDKKIIEIIQKISYNKKVGCFKHFEIDGSDIPDIVPVLTVLAGFCDGVSTIYNIHRLKIKESDRIHTIAVNVNSIGGKVEEYDDKLVITGVNSYAGGKTDSFNDHRIAMSMAIAAIQCKDKLYIKGADSVNKSYPEFFNDYKKLGGIINVINVE